MAKTLQEMRDNYAAGGVDAEANWNAAKGTMSEEWVRSMTEVLGHPPGPQMTAKFRAKIERARYKYGDPDKFIRNFDRAMSR